MKKAIFVLLCFPFTSWSFFVSGKITAAQNCGTEPAQMWVHSGKTLVYQIEVPLGSTFKVGLVPDKTYKIFAGTRNGCFNKKEYKIEGKGDDIKLTLVLDPVDPGKKGSKDRGPSYVDPYLSATQGSYCLMCAQQALSMHGLVDPLTSTVAGYYPFSDTSLYPSTLGLNASSLAGANWAASMGPYMSNNYNMPYSPSTAMAGFGDTMFYPGGTAGVGSPIFGKPNIYFRQFPEGEKVKIKIDTPKESFVIAEVPERKQDFWTGTVKNQKFVNEENVAHGYLFHDVRTDISLLQWDRGFCTKKKDLFVKLEQALHEDGFNTQEITEFSQHWRFKMPLANNYCVFPQGTEVMNKVAPLEVKTNIAAPGLRRLSFMIIPQDKLPKEAKEKYFRKPASEWKPQKTLSSDHPSLYEWGVAFLFF